jgi:hypothetical protein
LLFNPARIVGDGPVGIVLYWRASWPVADGLTHTLSTFLGGLVPVEGCARLVRPLDGKPRDAERSELVDGEAMAPPTGN